MFKKNKKQTETIKEPKEKKVRTVKVGTHKKTVIALWVVLIASVSFGVYKNFTAIDQHTTHEKEIIELRLQDTNGIENFVKNFAKSYYTWNNSKEAIESRTQAINGYLTKELQDLNVDTIRTDIPTSSTVTDVIVWSIEQSGTDTFSATYEVDQQIKEGEKTSNVKATYTVKVHIDADGDMLIVQNPTLARAGKEVERKARRVQILDISVEKIELPRVWMTVSCSKGTYIRTLCEDIGAKLRVGGCMESLLRTRVDRFQVKDSLKLDEIEVLRDEGKVGEYICSLEEALEGYLPVYTTAEGDKALKNGNPCFKQQLDLEKSTSLEERKSGDRYRMYNSQGIFMGVYEYQEEKHWWKPWKMFMPDGEGN